MYFKQPINTELDLFIAGIKPVILIHTKKDLKTIKHFCRNNIYIYKKTIRGERHKKQYYFWYVSHTPFESNPDELSTNELGVLLGYPPFCCTLFELNNDKFEQQYQDGQTMTYLDFNGMLFNTMGKTQEALQYCITRYGEKLKETQGFIWYQINTSNKDKGSHDGPKKFIY